MPPGFTLHYAARTLRKAAAQRLGFATDGSLSHIGVSEAQKTRVRSIAQAALDDLAPMREAHQANRKRQKAALLAPADVLTSEQRKSLMPHFESRCREPGLAPYLSERQRRWGCQTGPALALRVAPSCRCCGVARLATPTSPTGVSDLTDLNGSGAMAHHGAGISHGRSGSNCRPPRSGAVASASLLFFGSFARQRCGSRRRTPFPEWRGWLRSKNSS